MAVLMGRLRDFGRAIVLAMLALAWNASPVIAQEAPGTTPAAFAVTPDGTATYSVPLKVPPGTAGVEPKLSLVYSSRGGISAYGFGWSISGLSQIQRGPRNLADDANVAGVRFAADDALFLDGEKLVEVSSGVAGVREYRTRIDSMVRVRSYDPSATGPGYLVVETRAGLKMTYGATAASRVTLANGRVVTWLCDRIEDRSGNFMSFRYRFDDKAGKPGLDYVLDRVDFTGNESAALEPYASIVFDYERLAPDKAYGDRFLFGERTSLGWQLRSIESSYRGARLRRYVPTYTAANDSDKFLTIASLKEEGADGLHYRPLTFNYPQSRPGWQTSDLLAAIPDLPDIDQAVGSIGKSYRFARLPRTGGNAPAVLVSTEAGGKQIRAAYVYDGAAGEWKKSKELAPPALFAAGEKTAEDVLLVDVDDDGDDDLIVGNGLSGNESATYISEPSGWVKGPAFPIVITGRSLESNGLLAVDIRDASGQPRKAFAWDFIEPATGRRKHGVQRWDGADWKSVVGYDAPSPLSASGSRWVAGARSIDVDGDGVRELLFFSVRGSNRRSVYRATPAGWRPVVDPKYSPAIPDLPADTALKSADMNGDGLADLVWAFRSPAGQSSGIALAGSGGWQSDARTLPSVAFWRPGDDPVGGISGDLLDLNGDGIADFVDFGSGGATAFRGDATGWSLDDKLAPPSSLGATTEERETIFRTLRLPGSNAWVWLNLQPPAGSLAPAVFRLDAATGWQRDKSFKVPIDLAQFDKVDLGMRFLDLNNDGLPDLVWSRRKTDNSMDQNAYLFEPGSDVPWRRDVRYILPAPLVREDYLEAGTFVADVNGDGRVDLIEGRRTTERGRTIEHRETWINCAALAACAKVPETQVGGFWLPASKSPELKGLVSPTVFVEEGTGSLGSQILDVNGDGLSDIVTARSIEAWVDKDGEDVPAGTADASPVYRLDAKTWLNVDGRDWSEAPAFRLPVALSRPLVKGVQGGVSGDDAIVANVTMVDTRVQLIDLNGDRLPEVTWRYEAVQRVKTPSGVVVFERVMLSGAKLGSTNGWTTDASGYVPPVRLDDDPAANQRQLLMDDVNADGAIDLVFANGAASETYLNTGVGWSAPNLAYKLPAKAIRPGRGDQGFRMLDLNGDMLPDLAFHWTTDGGSVRGAYINTGTGWAEAPSDFAPALPFAEQDRGDIGVRPLDVNGDGLLDMVQSYKRSDSESRKQTQINVSNRSYLLTNARDGVGASVSVRYRSFLTVQRPDEKRLAPEPQVRMAPGSGAPAAYPIVHAPLPGYLVGEVTEVGLGVAARHKRFAYDGNRVDVRSGRSLGFEVSEVLDVERVRRTVTRFSQDDAFLGSPTSIEVFQDGRLISRTVSQWQTEEQLGLAGSTGVAGFSPRIVRRNLSLSKSETFDLTATLMASETSAFEYDGNGNPSRVTVAYADGSATVTENAYGDDVDKWVLARLTSARVTQTAPGAADQTREATFGYDTRSGLIAWERALVGTPLETITRFSRNQFGLKVSSATSAPDGSLAREERVEFDQEGRFAVRLYNALGQRSQTVFDPFSGVALVRTDPNGLNLKSRYDSLQKLVAETSPTGVQSTITSSLSSMRDAATMLSKRTPGLPTSRTWLDSAGRPVRTESVGWRGKVVITETKYDVLGRAIQTTVPRFDGHPVFTVTREYDQLDRPIREVRPDGAITRTDYFGLETVSTDVAGRKTIRRADLRGRIFEVVDAIGGVTQYRFDAGGRTVVTRTVAGFEIVQKFDAGGNRIELADPTTGRWRYSYDIFGSLIQQIDPRGVATQLTYDQLGRLVERRSGTSVAAWRYDDGDHAIGRLVASTSDARRTAIRYDAFGRAVRIEQRSKRDVLITTDRFDQLGRLLVRKFDTGVSIARRYDAQGFMTAMSLADGSVERVVYGLEEVDASGRITAESMGNGIVTRKRYDDTTGRLTGSDVHAGGATVLALSLTYDLVGNLTTLADGATSETGTFQYDALRRITRSELSGRPSVDVTYDAIGNIVSKSDVGSYSYCDRSGLRGLLCSVSGAAGNINIEYDQAGNVVRRGDKTIAFDADGKVERISGAAGSKSSFEYDGDGKLAFQDSLYGPKQHRYATTYFDGVQVSRENYAPPPFPTPERTIVRHELAAASGVFGYYDKIYRHYPYRFAAPIYGQIITQKPERATDLRFGLTYLVKDQLGSIRATLSEDGKVLERFRYDPWGRPIDGDGYRYRHVKEGFTGHQMLDNLDLIHMGGRVYDPVLGRFLSADPIIQAPYYSQAYNRYAYVMNNPLVLTDPTGYWSFGGFIRDVFRGASDAFRTVVDAVYGKPLAWVGEQLAKGGRWLQQNWQTVAIIAIACVMPAASAWYLAVLQGAAMGALSAALYGGGPDEILRGALIGGLSGGAFYGVGSAGLENRALAAGAHGAVGGVSSLAQGGDFQSGFLSAAVTKFSGSYIDPGAGQAYQVTSAAVIGGVASEVGGGSFENGAITGAFSRLFNDLAVHLKDPGPTEIVIVVNDNDPIIGTHTGMYVGEEGLYDPGGFYERKSPTIGEYVATQVKDDGPIVRIYRFELSKSDFSQISGAYSASSNSGMPGLCSSNCGAMIRGTGPFRDLGGTRTPHGMRNELDELVRRKRGVCLQPSGQACQ